VIAWVVGLNLGGWLQGDSLLPAMHFKRVQGREVGNSAIEIVGPQILCDVPPENTPKAGDHGFGVVVFTNLQIRIFQELHRVNLVFGAGVHGGVLSCGRQ
jgi:hypothetical protein